MRFVTCARAQFRLSGIDTSGIQFGPQAAAGKDGYMKRGFRILTAAALSASLAVSAVLPGWASDTQSEVPSGSAETELSSLIGGLEDSDAGSLAEKVKDKMDQTTAGSVKVEYGDLFYQLMAISEGEDAPDMSFLKSVTLDGTWTGGEDGYDASGTVSVNDTPFYDVQASLDPEEGILYLNVPDIKDQPVSINIGDMISEAMEEDTGNGSSVKDQLSQSAEIFGRLAEEGQAAFESVSDQEWSDFFSRYGSIIASGITVGETSETTVSAGSLQTDATLQSFSIQPEDMDKILQSCGTELSKDPVIEKILTSDFVTDVLSIPAASGSGYADGQQASPITGDQLYEQFRQFVTDNLSQISGAPGLSCTWGTDADGKLVSLKFDLIYSGASLTLFTANMINDGKQNAYDFQLGEFLASAIFGSTDSSSDSGETQSVLPEAQAGPTGLLLEGATEGGKLNETITVSNAGEAVFTVNISDWDVDKMDQGSFDGSITADFQGTPYTLQFSSDTPDDQTFRILISDSLLIGAAAQIHEGDPADVQKLDRSQAVEIRTEEDMENYLSDIDEDKVGEDLKEKAAAAGFPDEIINGSSGQDAEPETTAAA